MSQPGSDDLEALALAFLVRVHGRATPRALAEFRATAGERVANVASARIGAALRRARSRFRAGRARLFVCAGEACKARGIVEEERRTLLRDQGVPLELTGCQGSCERAAVVTLRVGERCEMFACLAERGDWTIAASFARRAAAANSLLIDLGPARPLRFDPIHDGSAGNEALRPLHFLLGHFAGEGRYADGGGWFHKEMIGGLEAGGRFLSLRMAVTYELDDGGKDRHEAFVIIGADATSGALCARAHTDGGRIHEYELETTRRGVRFRDIVTFHGGPAQPARKTLERHRDGIVERVELERGDGTFVAYSTLRLRAQKEPAEGDHPR